MSIHNRQYADTFSILNYLQNHCLWRKKRSKVGPLLSRKFQITYKIIVCGEETAKIGTILSWKSLKDPSWLAMCNVYFRDELSTGLPAHLKPFSIRVTSCQYELAVIFMCRLCIDIAMSNRHVVSFCEYSNNRYFQQSITALWNSLINAYLMHCNSCTCTSLHLAHMFHTQCLEACLPDADQCINWVEWSGELKISI